ncbi:LptF/LptG family permease [Capnocytophaga sp. ARDL2]|uniref:LptF/LptG family permease n=1 Tax=Capnocytophaga sp. ARDL2 TaxID=3238809 RepID=UPI0035563450
MKIIDKYILKTFTKIFLSVFGILYFIFILQAVWLFVGEFAGKDLDGWIIVQFLFYYSPNMIPMVLPLTVLLASIMSFGELSEHYEFAAMKSAGVSLQRALRPLFFMMIGLSILSFWFTNNVAPRAEFKSQNIKQEIIHTKPAMAITAGLFNDVGNMNIRVEKKTGDRGQYLDQVTMHLKNDNGMTNSTVIKADSGVITTYENIQLLKLKLLNGTYYEDVKEKSYSNRIYPHAKATFDTYTINVDLSKLNNKQELEEINNTAKMMNINQLVKTIDSLKIEKSNEEESFIVNNNSMLFRKYSKREIVEVQDTLSNRLDLYKPREKANILRNALSTTESMFSSLQNNTVYTDELQKNINRHWIIFNEKFVIAFSCILMFFIGAPLGAIIRKGGVGLPMILAILIFIIFHFINTFGRKVAQENGMNPFLGAWLSTLILLPLAFFNTYKAAKDRGINSLDNTLYPVTQFIKKHIKKLKKQKDV